MMGHYSYNPKGTQFHNEPGCFHTIRIDCSSFQYTLCFSGRKEDYRSLARIFRLWSTLPSASSRYFGGPGDEATFL
jgi:hypothetical protein